MSQDQIRDSERYKAQADAVMRLAARAGSPAERQVYADIAAGWRRLAAEAARHERQQLKPQAAKERRSFNRPRDD